MYKNPKSIRLSNSTSPLPSVMSCYINNYCCDRAEYSYYLLNSSFLLYLHLRLITHWNALFELTAIILNAIFESEQ